jgi:cellulose synthase/poly-beta-1,6-N-acetylglucosamine synthase-like glycosyltransferase
VITVVSAPVYFFYFLAALALWFGIQSLLSGIRYAAYVRREMSRALPEFQPFVSVIAPNRGIEPGLAENIRALLAQEYPEYEVVFVFDSADDSALDLINEIRAQYPQVKSKTVVALAATDRGQKVHNLRVGFAVTDSNSEVLVFVDSDARPEKSWLRQLVAPLADEKVGASTGYRWFISERGGLSSRLRGVWNASIASALGADTHKNFCWGGSTAIRRSTFAELKIMDHWGGSVSDDFTVTRVLKEAQRPVHFRPHCLVASVGDCDFKELLEFTTRQIKITRVYASQLWLPLLLGSALFTLVFFGGLILLVLQILSVLSASILLPVLLIIIFTLGATKAFIRWRAVNIPLNSYAHALRRDLLAHIFLWPIASLLYLYNAIAAGFSRRIKWRGITYELKSPTEAVIISREF